MKKRNVIIIVLILVFILVYFILNYFILNFFSNSYFSVDYDVEFSVVSVQEDSLSLVNDNGTLININADKLDNDLVDEEVYLSVVREFQEQNLEYRLINYDETMIGKEFYDGYQYLYETDEKQAMLVVVIVEDILIQASYVTSNQFFDIDLEDFYSIINSIEV